MSRYTDILRNRKDSQESIAKIGTIHNIPTILRCIFGVVKLARRELIKRNETTQAKKEHIPAKIHDNNCKICINSSSLFTYGMMVDDGLVVALLLVVMVMVLYFIVIVVCIYIYSLLFNIFVYSSINHLLYSRLVF